MFVLRIWILILYINREPETSMFKKWLFQSDDEPNLYMENDCQITISIHLKTDGLGFRYICKYIYGGVPYLGVVGYQGTLDHMCIYTMT